MKARHALVIGIGVGAIGILAFGAIAGGGAVLELAGKVAGVTRSGAGSPSPEPAESPAPASAAPSLASPTPTPAPTPSANNPGPRTGAAMVYDPENHGLILFGGATALPQPDGTNLAHAYDDTWLWNGQSWRRLEVAGPSTRSGAMAAYDSVRHEIVLFGGGGVDEAGNGSLLNDTWVWDGTEWHLRQPLHNPEPRFRAAMAFDQARGVAVMIGGEGAKGKVYTATTWTWDGADWTAHNASTTPTARTFAGMAYSASTKEAVLYGGTWAGRQLSDTWLWDGSNWRRGPAGPAAGWTLLTYDDALNAVVGYIYTPSATSSARLITWDGKTWSNRTSATIPSPRAQASLGYDAVNSRVVLYGGSYIEPVPYAETWIWNHANWSLWEQPSGA